MPLIKSREDTSKDSLLEKGLRMFFENSAQLVNTGRAGLTGVGGLAQIAGESIFGDDESYEKKVKSVAEHVDRDLYDNPGLLGVGTSFDTKEDYEKVFGKDGEGTNFKEFGKKVVGEGVNTAMEVVPMMRGGSAVTKGKKFFDATKGLTKEGLAYGAAQTGADYLETGEFDPKNAAINMLTSVAGTNVPFMAGRGGKNVLGKGKKAFDKVSDVASRNPSVMAIDDHLKALTQKREQLMTSGAPKSAITANDKAYSMALREKDRVVKSINEGGYLGLGGKEPEIDLTPKTPEQAKRIIADIKPEAPKVVPKQQAMDIVSGAPKPGTKVAGNAATPVGEGAKTIAERLDDQLKELDVSLKAPDEVLDVLSRNAELTSRPARRHDWLDNYEDTLSVLGRYQGKVGTDFGYKLAEGAKKIADIQEVVRPNLQKSQKLLNKMAKTKSGRAEIQARVATALEDRANVATYLKTPDEMELFEQTRQVLDFFKDQRVKLGKAVVGENYSPRAAVKNALDAPDRMMNDIRSAFSPDVESAFSKKRVLDEAVDDIDRNIIDLLPRYVSSQAKEFGYEDAMGFLKEALPNLNPAYLTNAKSRRKGEEYLRTLITQVLDPPSMSKWERRQNAALAVTYRNQLGFSPRFAAQNMTQRYATKTAVSKEAAKLAKKMDGADLVKLRENIITGQNPITADLGNADDALLGKESGFMKKLGKVEPGQAVERGNVGGAFDRGAAQAILESDIYKGAIKQGLKPREAAKMALKDADVRDLAIRRGNIVVNDTQFGANFVTKPEFFRKQGTFFGISDKFLKQYQRFPVGMVQNLSTMMRMKDARALDILKRGDPRETKLVDFLYSAKSMENGVDDLIKGIKRGEIVDVPLDVAQGYRKELAKAVKTLDKEIKSKSQLRAGKSAKNYVKMWMAASAIQFLFDGGLGVEDEDEQAEKTRKALIYGAPINVPTKDRNPITQGIVAPSFPRNADLSDPRTVRKLTNFIPGVGLVVNRGADAKKFIDSLVGE